MRGRSSVKSIWFGKNKAAEENKKDWQGKGNKEKKSGKDPIEAFAPDFAPVLPAPSRQAVDLHLRVSVTLRRREGGHII
jgi:hypothetical protein